METSLTLLDSGMIDMRAIDRILQSVVFFADKIAIRATYETARPEAAREIDRLVSSLHEQGFLTFWAHEYEVNDAGMARNPRREGGARRPADLVIEKQGLTTSLGEMDEIMRRIREEAYEDTRQGAGRLRQGVGEIIGLRSHLTSLVISSELNQDGLLSNPAARTALATTPSGPGFETEVVREVVGMLQLGSLARLSPDQIQECRGYTEGFRDLLDQSLLAAARGTEPVLTPMAIAKELTSKYKAIASEYALPKLNTGEDMGREVFWDVVGATLPASLFLKYGIEAFRWRKAAAAARPYLLLMHLERALHAGPAAVRRP